MSDGRSRETDYAAGVVVRLVDRLLKAEAALVDRQTADEFQQKAADRLLTLLRPEPEYTLPLRETNSVHLVTAACNLIERLKRDAGR